MLLLKAQRLIRKRPDPIIPSDRVAFSNMSPKSKSPLERNPLSPTGWKKRESEGVGLGIVVALQISNGERSATKDVVKISTKTACYGRFLCCLSPKKKGDHSVFDTADFLSCCYMCKKNLQGKDIYMYREIAFCSKECRHQQIVADEFQEKCRSEAYRSDVYDTLYTEDRLFSTGIAVA